ncbi:MAG: antirestriction protein ArdA [Litorimonas sp.]
MTIQTLTPSRETDCGPDGPRGADVGAPPPIAGPHTPEPANPSGDRPAIYVACLAAYNNQTLHGAWIWADDADEMRAATQAMLARSPEPGAEEWAIHDYAGFEGLSLSEYQSFEAVAEMAAFIEERGALGAKVAEHYGGDLDDARKAFEEYAGEYESFADYARELMEDCGPKVPEAFRYYIDWASMGEDMELNGDIVSFEMGIQSVHIFRSW